MNVDSHTRVWNVFNIRCLKLPDSTQAFYDFHTWIEENSIDGQLAPFYVKRSGILIHFSASGLAEHYCIAGWDLTEISMPIKDVRITFPYVTLHE